MWFVAEVGANNRLKTTTFKLFDNQKEAEAYANSQTDCYSMACFYFAKSGEKYTKKWRYRTTELVTSGSWNTNNFKRDYVPNNNADFTP